MGAHYTTASPRPSVNYFLVTNRPKRIYTKDDR
jgi:hypothetical protein